MSSTTTTPAGTLVPGPSCPKDLATDIADGRPLLLHARVATPGGQRTFLDLARQVRTVARELAHDDVFPDLHEFLPSCHDLVERMRIHAGQAATEIGPDGVTAYPALMLQSAACPQIHLHLSCGPLRSVDSAASAIACIRTITPAVLCATDITRWSRSSQALLQWATAVQALERQLGHPAHVSFCGSPPRPWDSYAMSVVTARATDEHIRQTRFRRPLPATRP